MIMTITTSNLITINDADTAACAANHLVLSALLILLRVLQTTYCSPNEELCLEGEEPPELFIVRHGQVFKRTRKGQKSLGNEPSKRAHEKSPGKEPSKGALEKSSRKQPRNKPRKEL